MRKSLVALIATGTALSLGSVGVPPASAYTWTVTTLATGTRYSEPGIDVDPGSGTIYVNAIAGIPSVSSIWKSTNDGGTWSSTPGTLRNPCLGGGDSDLAVHPDGTLSWTDLWLGSASVCRSTDMADLLWIGHPLSVPVQDRQWLAAAGTRTYLVTHQIPSGLVVAKSYDGGVTYPDQMLAVDVLQQGNCICPPGNIIAVEGANLGLPAVVPHTGADDYVGVIYSIFNAGSSTGCVGCYGVAYEYSKDGGKTWSRSFIANPAAGDTTASFPVVTHGGGGVLHAVYADVTAGGSVVKYSRSNDWGAHWTTPATISTGSAIFPWVDAKGSQVSVAYYHNTTAGNPSSVGGSWDVTYIEGTYSATPSPSTSWGTEQNVDTGVKSGNICVDGLDCSADRELGDFLQVAIRHNASTDPIISYIKVGNNPPSTTQVRVATV